MSRPYRPAKPDTKNIIQKVGGAIAGAASGAAKGIDDYATGTGPKGEPVMSAPILAPLTAAVGAIRGGYLGAQGKYTAPKSKNFTSSDYKTPADKAKNLNRVTGSGTSMQAR
jgi:hypothetical protein